MLIAEDEKDVRKMLADYFTVKGWETETAENGQKALEILLKGGIQIALLDIMMPKMDGLEVCRRLRETSQTVPVIFLTALETEQMQLKGYGYGADDYVTKPFSLPVLEAKILAVMRRYDTRQAEEVKGIVWDREGRRFYVAGQFCPMPEIEYKMMTIFMENEGILLTREQILNKVWGPETEVFDRVVDKHLVKLRKILGTAGDAIKTVPKAGYRYEGD